MWSDSVNFKSPIRILVLSLLLASSCSFAAAMSAPLAGPARAALDRGHADEALKQIDAMLSQNASDAEAHNLRCRVFYQERHWDEAISECRLATQLAPASSEYHLWLGRALGEKADRVSFIEAFKLARQVRSEFESAASLDPHNAEALSDLAEFYQAAPGIVGGGTGKAEKVARQLLPFAPDRAHEIWARLAEQKKDYKRVETEFKAAIANSPAPARAWIDLAGFYRRQKRWDDMMTALKTGASLDTQHGVALVDGASLLVHAGREPQLATEWMRQYLNSAAQSEEAPAFVIHEKLGHLLEQQGDPNGAQQEYAAARALATGYTVKQQSATNTGR
jgi:tetratricopeptide (TPR) repeat protein